MTHFMVTARLPALVERDHIEGLVNDVLLPFKEYDGDFEVMQPYLEFHDTQDEDRETYDTDTTEQVRLPGGTLVSPYDERFRVKGTIGMGTHTHKVPTDLERVQVPISDEYESFDEFQKEYTGNNAMHPETGRYGYWHNPQGRWDWWQIGGRYGERLNGLDIVRIAKLDLESADRKRSTSALEWLNFWNRYRLGETLGWKDCPREMALRMGVMKCVDERELTGDEIQVIPWPNPERKRCDVVLREVTNEDVERSPMIDVFDPLRGAVRFDATVPVPKWDAPGEFGWFGTCSDTPESYLEFVAGFRSWIAGGDPRDWLVVVDCHV